MSSAAAAAGDVLPALPPIRTAAPSQASQAPASASAPEPACSSAASSSTAPAPDAESVTLPAPWKGKEAEEEPESEAGGQDQAEEAEPTTPTSEGSRLRAPAECPLAPRKPSWAAPATPPAAKRKFPSSAAPSARRAFFPVARDLTTVFRALPPPKKRIRAG
ncbi:unnamed protein product [Urochloa decumbens]|uniref:Uncharacterized protein n=1 Tax=Urochloa decumbens TaxID=240449 RepID=A0ABC9BG18_9POAL